MLRVQMHNCLLSCVLYAFVHIAHKKRCLFFKSDCHILQMMKSDPFVQCSQYLHQLQYDVNVNTVLTDDNRMTLLDLIIAFRQSCINNSDPSHHRVVQGFVVSDLLERLWCFESNGFKTVFVFALSVHVCVCFAFITWMFLLSLFLPVVPRILPHTQSGSERLRVLL